MHYQVAPHEEAKLITCLSGSIFDVIIDLRVGSSTYGEWLSVQLLSGPRRPMLYVPEGFAHGFQTLEDNTEVLYQISKAYTPDSARGIRWNDPSFAIRWPEGQRIMSDRDHRYPDFVSALIDQPSDANTRSR
jgi:dTDP-4-dehydrorhamnose 3,5-epimerase